jgi:glycosyltransferase involved in cell wall biosynthesis
MPVPLASVIIPTYNYARFIRDAIESVLNQTVPRQEIETIVVDDGSQDGTYDVVKRYGPGVRYVGQVNGGKAIATRVGIENARGKYIFNLDADDMFRPRRIEAAVEVFERNEQIVHVGHPALLRNEDLGHEVIEPVPADIKNKDLNGKLLLVYFYRRRLLFGGGSTFAGRARTLKTIRIAAAIDMCIDEYLVMWMLNAGESFFVNEPLSIWRIHGGNFSAQQRPADVGRVQRGMDAVLALVVSGQFDDEIKVLYVLKTRVARVAAKETTGEKSVQDVLDMWLWVIQHRRLFSGDVWRVIHRYTLVKRSLPTCILRLLKVLARRHPGRKGTTLGADGVESSLAESQ